MGEQERIRAQLVRIGRKRAAAHAAYRRVTADARVLAARALAAGLSPQEIAELTGFQPRTVERWEGRIVRAERRGLLAALLTRWRRRAQGADQGASPAPPAYFSDV